MKALGALVAALAAVLAVVLGSGGSDPYRVRLHLANANGLATGSPVSIGGVHVGQVRLRRHQDEVAVDLEIERKYAPVGRDVKAQIIARNALGQKQVLLIPGASGNRSPAPDGFDLPAAQVDVATDLDELISTLDPDTRTRLAVLLNESGIAFAGRKVDFKTLLRELAPALSSGTDLLGELDSNNRVLRNLLTSSDRFIGSVAQERRLLTRLIDQVGRTTETVSARRAELRATLHRAPAALAQARSFLAELRRTAEPLGATARLLAKSAPPLQATIANIEPFRAAAAPTLASATDAAPSLERLAARTRPSLEKAVPALESLRAASQNEVPGVGRALDGSMDNLLATVDNWSRAIQFRDGLSHIFRGEASFGPSFYERILKSLGAKLSPKHRTRRRTPQPNAPAPQSLVVKPKLPEVHPRLPGIKVPELPHGKAVETVKGVLDRLSGKQPSTGTNDHDSQTKALLDFLLTN